MRKLLFIILIAGIFSCKQKPSHQDALNYYVSIRLQIKEVTTLVKEFSPQFSKIIKNEIPSKRNSLPKEIDSFKNSIAKLIQQINERLIVVNELPVFKGGTLIQLWAGFYIKDTRNFLFRISQITSEKIYAANSDLQKKKVPDGI